MIEIGTTAEELMGIGAGSNTTPAEVPSNSIESRGPGRPIGTSRPSTWAVKYPIKWKPIYDQMVLEYAVTNSIKGVAEKYNYTPVQVGNIVRSPLAQQRLKEIRANVNSAVEEKLITFADKSDQLKEACAKRMVEFVTNDNYQTASPFAFIDRVAKIHAAVAPPPKVENLTLNQNKTIVISGEMTQNVIDALNVSKEVGLMLNAG